MLPANKEALTAMLNSIRERKLPVEREARIVNLMKRLGYEVPPRQA